MEPQIEATEFGSITVAGQELDIDIVIDLDGALRKRKKKLSKEIYATSHVISLDEAKDVYQKGAERLIIGTGQQDMVRLSPEAEKYFARHDCRVEMLPTGEAAEAWNQAQGKVIGLFHITC